MLPTTADAVAASVGAAALVGLPTAGPVVVAEGYSVRVRLDPAPVLTRVVTVGRTLRGEPLPWMQREVDACRFLRDRGAAVGAPWRDAGPHRAHGLDVTLWEWLEPDPQPLTRDAYGRLLRDLHDALLDHDAALPVLVGPLTDIARAVELTGDALLAEAADLLVPLALSWPRRPLHGDAHTGNLLTTRDGPRWIDFEDVCVGPVEWDLASRTVDDELVAAYPGEVDRELLADCRSLRDLQVLACVLTDDVQDPALRAALTARLTERLRGRPLSS